MSGVQILALCCAEPPTGEAHPGMTELYRVLLEADKKLPGAADKYWLEFYDATIADDSITIDWMFNVLKQRQDAGITKLCPLDGNDLNFHLSEAITYRPDDIIRAIKLNLVDVVDSCLVFWSNFPESRRNKILDALDENNSSEMQAIRLKIGNVDSGHGKK